MKRPGPLALTAAGLLAMAPVAQTFAAANMQKFINEIERKTGGQTGLSASSLKNKLLEGVRLAEKKAPQIRIVQRGDVQEALMDGFVFARFPKGVQVVHDYSAQPKENIQLGKITSDVLGMQFENAKAYHASAKCIGGVKDGTLTGSTDFKGKDMFTQGQVVTSDSCDWRNYPPGSDAETSQMRMFYMQNVGPWNIYDVDSFRQAAEAMRQFAMKYGEPYIGDVLLLAPPGTEPTKWMFLSGTYLKGNGALADRPPMVFSIVGIGIDDADVFPTINQAHLGYLTASLLAPVKMWNWVNVDNHEYEVRGACLGAYATNSQGNTFPVQACTVVQSIITDVENRPSVLPTKFRVESYPNPFNPSTTIRFDLPRTGRVAVKVINTAGQTVTNLDDRVLVAGTHEVRFDAAKLGLSSGVYYGVVFVDGQYQGVTKMMLVK